MANAVKQAERAYSITADDHALIAQIKVARVYEHYKGKKYKVIGVSRHSEDLSWYVVYQAYDHDNPAGNVWHRPIELFLGNEIKNGHPVRRFRLVE